MRISRLVLAVAFTAVAMPARAQVGFIAPPKLLRRGEAAPTDQALTPTERLQQRLEAMQRAVAERPKEPTAPPTQAPGSPLKLCRMPVRRETATADSMPVSTVPAKASEPMPVAPPLCSSALTPVR